MMGGWKVVNRNTPRRKQKQKDSLETTDASTFESEPRGTRRTNERKLENCEGLLLVR